MARLMGVSAEKIQARRARFAEAAAKRFHATVVLKGARSIIAESGRPLSINPTGNPGMATGGTGDVLTGMVAGLIAQGLLPFEAATAATYLHGLAGDIAAGRLGEASLVAGDVLAAVPDAIQRTTEGGPEDRLSARSA
jgi:NAD(P)H-hydrate epimerase